MSRLRMHLSYPVSSIHGLQISHWVPIVLHKHYGICSSEIQSQPTHMSGEQQDIYRWVIIEPGRGGKTRLEVFLKKSILDPPKVSSELMYTKHTQI